jgi:UDP-N-acetylmuramate: L-alanyl-gamma-D-glutamyl-meso-diaminopimelate ligase
LRERRVQQRLYILGICGTFMGGLALLARERGFSVGGCDSNVYPPMSMQLEAAGIALDEGYDPACLPGDATIVVGNALSRGNPCVEAMLDRGLRYQSGPQWLAENLLAGSWVLAASGTHGKTTVSSMLAWILDCAGLEPGFLIGGVPLDFGRSARGGGGRYFVVEADEYDTAFFDKRAKFLHYRPRTLVVNNLEFDHADIYPDLASIQRQFHHLLRCVPGNGLVITPAAEAALDDMLAMGCWTPRQTVSVQGPADWRGELLSDDGGRWRLQTPDGGALEVSWRQRGLHNIANALAAVAAAGHVGVAPAAAVAALARFRGVRRRLELLGEPRGIRVFDDFAHHPTAIRATLEALRGDAGCGRILVLMEPRSNTMRMGKHRGELAQAVAGADRIFWYQPTGLDWSLEEVAAASPVAGSVHEDIAGIVGSAAAEAREGDAIVIMSNGSFGGVHQRLLDALDPGGR